MNPSGDRSYDIVQFGATGYAGRLVADHLAGRAPANCKWALAGRSIERLAAVAREIAELRPDGAPPEVIEVDLLDQAALEKLARETRCIVSTAGPFTSIGEPLIAAAARGGAAYADISADPAFIDEMFIRHHDEAVRTGARLVQACGFRSVPQDLGAWLAVSGVPNGGPVNVSGVIDASMSMSGTTLDSMMTAVSSPLRMARAARARKRLTPPPTDGRKTSAKSGRIQKDETRGWLGPLPGLDEAIVTRSAAGAERYGPDFSYSQQVVIGGTAKLGLILLALPPALLLVQLPPVRWLLRKVKPAGSGPTEEQRAKGHFRAEYVARGGGEECAVEVAGGDPGYEATAKMVAEVGLALAFDDLPETSGQVTPALACGDALIDRLGEVGMPFRIVGAGAGLMAASR